MTMRPLPEKKERADTVFLRKKGKGENEK